MMLKARMAIVALLLLPVSLAAVPQQADVAFEDGRYRQGPFTFDVPRDWTYVGTNAPAATVAVAHWTDPRTGANLYVRMTQQNTAPGDVAPILDGAVANKTQQRARDGYRQWRVRPESVSRTVIAGNQALSATADYTSNGTGAPRVELLTWVIASTGRAQFFAFVSPEQAGTFQPDFERVVSSARVP